MENEIFSLAGAKSSRVLLPWEDEVISTLSPNGKSSAWLVASRYAHDDWIELIPVMEESLAVSFGSCRNKRNKKRYDIESVDLVFPEIGDAVAERAFFKVLPLCAGKSAEKGRSVWFISDMHSASSWVRSCILEEIASLLHSGCHSFVFHDSSSKANQSGIEVPADILSLSSAPILKRWNEWMESLS